MKTKSKKDVKKKRNRRSASKYPALEKKFTIKCRQEFLETEYINGVCNDKGEQVIRALTDEEKKWLNKFYQEELNAGFNHDDPFSKTKAERKRSYDANNARNRDIYNRQNTMGMLDELTEESYVSVHGVMTNLKDELEESINSELDAKLRYERENYKFED